MSLELPPQERIRSALARCVDASGWADGPVCVMIDTLKTVLVPSTLFDPANTNDYLAVNNISEGMGEEVVVSRLSDGSITVISVCEEAVAAAVGDMFGAHARFASPFDTAIKYGTAKYKKKDAGKEFTSLYLTEKNVYITIQAIPLGEWRYCEVLPYSTTADLLYYMQELSARFDIRKTPLYASGANVEKVAKALQKSFRIITRPEFSRPAKK